MHKIQYAFYNDLNDKKKKKKENSFVMWGRHYDNYYYSGKRRCQNYVVARSLYIYNLLFYCGIINYFSYLSIIIIILLYPVEYIRGGGRWVELPPLVFIFSCVYDVQSIIDRFANEKNRLLLL